MVKKYPNFADEILNLAQQFEDEKILNLLEVYGAES